MTGRLSPFLLVLAALALLNLLAVPLLHWATDAGPGGVWVMGPGMGAFLAQFGILPAWLVWGRRPFWLRTLIHWCSASGLLLALVLGSHCTKLGPMFGPSPTIVRDVFLVALI